MNISAESGANNEIENMGCFGEFGGGVPVHGIERTPASESDVGGDG
jgi:hypothetical protein